MAKGTGDIVVNEGGQAFVVFEGDDELISTFFDMCPEWEERTRWHITEDKELLFLIVEDHIELGYN